MPNSIIKPFGRPVLYEFVIGGVAGLPAWIESLDSCESQSSVLGGVHGVWKPSQGLTFKDCLSSVPGSGFTFNHLKQLAREGCRRFSERFGEGVHLVAPYSVGKVRDSHAHSLNGKSEVIHGLRVSAGLLVLTATPVCAEVIPRVDRFGYFG